MRGGSNLEAKRKRLNIVFATLYAAKQGECRAEQAQARQTTMRPARRVACEIEETNNIERGCLI